MALGLWNGLMALLATHPVEAIVGIASMLAMWFWWQWGAGTIVVALVVWWKAKQQDPNQVNPGFGRAAYQQLQAKYQQLQAANQQLQAANCQTLQGMAQERAAVAATNEDLQHALYQALLLPDPEEVRRVLMGILMQLCGLHI